MLTRNSGAGVVVGGGGGEFEGGVGRIPYVINNNIDHNYNGPGLSAGLSAVLSITTTTTTITHPRRRVIHWWAVPISQSLRLIVRKVTPPKPPQYLLEALPRTRAPRSQCRVFGASSLSRHRRTEVVHHLALLLFGLLGFEKNTDGTTYLPDPTGD